jgi:hypothetical protein
MPKRTPKWTFWILGWDKGPVWKKLQDSYLKWPTGQFERLAQKRGFRILLRDDTLIGGHFSHPDTGDCLICYPHGMDPAEVY